MKHRKGLLLIVMSSLLFGSYGTWAKLMGDSFDPFSQSWMRSLLIALCILPILLWKKEIVSIPRKDWGWLAVVLAFTSLTVAPIYYAFNHMDIGSATLLFFCTMLLTMYVFGALFFNEKLTKVKIVSFILAVCGMYIIFSFSLFLFSILAAGMAILNGFATGGEISLSKKLSGKYSTLYLTWLCWIAVFSTNVLISFALGESQRIPAFEMPWVYFLGHCVASGLSFWLIVEGLKYVEAGIGGLVGLLEIVFSVGLGVIIFHESLTSRIVIGGLLIICAAALPHIIELRTSSKSV